MFFMDNASSYLSIFLNDIEQTKNYLAAYNNLILLFKSQFPTKKIIDGIKNQNKILSEQERIQLLNTIGYFRTYSTRAYTTFNSLKENFNIKSEEKVKTISESYKHIKESPIPKYEIAEAFVQSLSDLAVNEINVQALVNTNEKLTTLAQASETPELD